LSTLEKLAEQVAARGTRTVFGVPGSGASLSLIDALNKRGVSFQLTHFEGTAAIMAGTFGRLTNRAGVALSIKGPGLANMVPGLTACHFESFPIVAMAEAYPPEAPPERAHKRLDHDRLVAGVSKGQRFISHRGPDFDDLASWAESEVPGPVVLNIADSAVETETAVPEVRHDVGEAGLSDWVKEAQRPVVIAGSLAIRQGWSAQLNQLQVPVFSTAAAKGVVDETLPQAAGVHTGVGLERVPESSLLGEADLVIGLGLRSSEVLAAAPFTCKSINIDAVDAASSAPGFEFAAVGDVCEAETVFDALTDTDKAWGLAALATKLDALREHMLGGPFAPAHAFDVIEAHFDGRARLVLDTGYFCVIGEHAWRAKHPDWCLGSGQARYMGIGLPMAVAAAMKDPSLPTILAAGDGGIGMFFAELKLAVEHKLPLLVLLMTDGGFGSIRTRAINEGLSQIGLVLPMPSWLRAAEGLGLPVVRVETASQFETALASWEPATGPMYIEAVFEPANYQAMVEGIR